jgi:hypothetical protein
MSEMDESGGYYEEIPDGDTPPEEDVSGNQAPSDWKGEPSSDAGLTPEAKRRLGLEGA